MASHRLRDRRAARRVVGLAIAIVGPAALTALLTLADQPIDFRPGVWFLLVVVVASLLAGLWGLAIGVTASLIGLVYSVSPPAHHFGTLDQPEWWGLLGFLLVAVSVGLLVTRLEAAVRERDTAVEARDRTEAAAAAERELEATRTELFASELKRLRARRLVDSLQEAMLPHDLPVVTGLELDACYTPATPDLAVGGDWYDAFLVDAGTLAFAVGDVSGHGVDAAALMAQLRNALRAYAFETSRPADVLGRLNRFLCGLDTQHFATAVFGTISLDDGSFVWSIAGHPAPVRFGYGQSALLDADDLRGPLLGFRPHAVYGEATCTLEVGEGLLVYTDGLIERRGEHLDEGGRRLLALVSTMASEPTAQLCDRIVERIAGGHEGRDDVCQLVLRRPANP